jgi:protein-L-isoaspartate(D-aspartate) O-methyltransferase
MFKGIHSPIYRQMIKNVCSASAVWMIFLILFLCLPAPRALASPDKYAGVRLEMVRDQIERRGVMDDATLSAMRAVKRHLFVPESLRARGYNDNPLPIGFGQTISQPYIVAYMTEVIQPGPHQKILEIGTGSGYQAAVLAEIVERVYTIEIIPELGKAAAERLEDLGYKNIEVKIADGYFGWKDAAPFDAIVVTAAAEYIPPPLVAQLKDGGRMIIPVGSPFMVQMLMLVEKKGESITTRSLMPVRFVPFRRNR